MNLRHGLIVPQGMYVIQCVWGKSVGRYTCICPNAVLYGGWMNLRHGLIVLQGMYVIQGVWGEECGQVCISQRCAIWGGGGVG